MASPRRTSRLDLPIEHWSFSSLMSYLRNPLAWYKRYVEKVYDMPSSPAGVIGRSAHKALEHFYYLTSEDHAKNNSHDRRSDGSKLLGENSLPKAYSSEAKEYATAQGLRYLRNVPDFEINFGKATSKRAQKQKRGAMEKEYLQAIGFYLARAPRHTVVGVEVVGMGHVNDLPLPVKAISDLVVESPVQKGALDIVDHKFVDSFSTEASDKPLFVLQALFNYYTVTEAYDMPVRRMIIQECKKRKNKDGKSQMRRYIIDFSELGEEYDLFHRLLSDATLDLANRKVFLPNPSDMFEGTNSFEIYKMGL